MHVAGGLHTGYRLTALPLNWKADPKRLLCRGDYEVRRNGSVLPHSLLTLPLLRVLRPQPCHASDLVGAAHKVELPD